MEHMFGTMCNTLEKMFLPEDSYRRVCQDGRLARFVILRRLNRRLPFGSLLRTSNSRAEMHYRAKDGLVIIEYCTLWPVMGSTIKNDYFCRRLSDGQSAWTVASTTHRMAIPWKHTRWFSPTLSATGLSTMMRARPCSIRLTVFLSTVQRRKLVANSSTGRSHGSGRGTCGCHCANL